MILKYSFIQFFRSKWVATLLSFLLVSVMLTISCCVWVISNHNINAYEEQFTTIGYAQQKESETEVIANWDSITEQYSYWDQKIYRTIQPPDLLNFYEDYIVPPKQRPFLLAYSDDVRYFGEDNVKQWEENVVSTIVFTPYETVTPSKPVRMKIVQVIYSKNRNMKVGEDIWICAHHDPKPEKLEKGKTYITSVNTFLNFHEDSDEKAYYESQCYNIVQSEQVEFGEVSKYVTGFGNNWEEVIDGKVPDEWMVAGEAQERLLSTVCVTTAPSMETVYEFHEGGTNIVDGKSISEEQFENGEKVCIIPQNLATHSNLKVGDKLKLSFYAANYKSAPSQTFSPGGSVLMYSMWNKKEELYPVFEEIEYIVAGIFYGSGSGRVDNPTGFELTLNEVIVPEKSINADHSDNILAWGPMSGSNTVFQIPNGKSAEFMSQMTEAGVDGIEVRFYDNGYEELASGMKSMRQIAVVSMAVSAFALLIVLLLLCYMVIQKQAMRTAIERSVGLNPRQCMVSLASAFCVVLFFGSAIGAGVGYLLSEKILSVLNQTLNSSFSMAFSAWTTSAESVVAQPAVWYVPIIAAVVIFLCALCMIGVMMRRNLKQEALALLSVKNG
jgi:ABC-type transport system, involved in lipoprotein release, permease component